jgi:hypothetical protein
LFERKQVQEPSRFISKKEIYADVLIDDIDDEVLAGR